MGVSRRTADRRAFQYAVAFATVALATVLRRALDPLVGANTPFITYFPALVFTVWTARLGASLFALALSTLAAGAFFMSPPFGGGGTAGLPQQIGLVVFVFVGLAIIGVAEAMRRAEAEAARRAETLRITLASIGDAVITTDTAGNVTSLNPVAEGLTGWTEGEARGRPLEEVFAIADEATRTPVVSPVRQVLAQGVVVGLANHTVLRTRDGRENPIDDSAAPILGDDGTILGVVLVFRDVSEERGNARRLARSEAEKAAILATAPDCVISIDADGRIVEFNAAAERALGHRRDDVLGRDMADLIIPPAERSRHRAGLAYYLATGTGPILGRRLEMTALRADGSEIPVELSITAIEGLPRPLFTGFLRDISDRRRVEQEREAAEANLARIAADLVETDRRKSEFLAMLAHELRNPLAPMRNAMEILRRKDGRGEESAAAMEMMGRQLRQMVRLVDDLLDASRMSRDRIELRRERVPLATIVEHAAEAARPPCDEQGQSLTVELPDEPLWLDGDPARLVQVLGNLLSNACKFTPRGGAVRLIADREGDQAVIRVVDNGIGIAPDHQARIFELFTQVDSSLERSQGGLGIGLTLVRTLVEKHGGRVELESAGPERGSTFTVRLPLAGPPAGAAQPVGPAAGVGAAVEAPPRRILVVDDNADSAESLALLLRLSGHEVHVAHDGGAAVAAAAAVEPDVVLLDIGLPVLNGYEAASRIRRLRNGGQPFLVAVTGWGQEEDRRRSREAGFDAHLVKPVDAEVLTRLLAEEKP